MHGAITAKLLEIIEGIGGTTDFIFETFFTDYATSYRRLRGIERRTRNRTSIGAADGEHERERFYKMLWHLKHQGLIEKKKRAWRITFKGKRWRKRLAARAENTLPSHAYTAKRSPALTLVIFDIPERERRKRLWLRVALMKLGFTRLQKSVWTGKVVLPETFLVDLRTLHLLSYVEIFSITKAGSLRPIQ